MTDPLTEGTTVCIAKLQLQELIDRLRESGYHTIGPQLSDAAIVYDDLDSIEQLPIGYIDEQDGGHYRLEQRGTAWFDYVVGPHSLKNFLFPPQETLVQLDRVENSWQTTVPQHPSQPLAVIGPRSCDLHAVKIQDRVFLGDKFVDPAYQARRSGLFVAAVNCRRAAATCFCHSMKTGPSCTLGFDLLLSELDDRFVIEIEPFAEPRSCRLSTGSHVLSNNSPKPADNQNLSNIKCSRVPPRSRLTCPQD